MKEELHNSLYQESILNDFVGSHASFVNLIKKLKRISNKNVSLLLIGETGTGKGRCAEFVHQYGKSRNFPFIPYNCGSGPDSLFESQLFGHAKGSFTGAYKNKVGLVEEAHQGILFLDEINSLPHSLQVKLNHFLETGIFRRIGESRIRSADIRIIAASNIDLRKAMLEGRFREDLFYRLSEYELHVPPLRARKEDIILLAKHFLKKHKKFNDEFICSFSSNAMEQLTNYRWPGNIRELENFIKKCIIDATSRKIESVGLPALNGNLNRGEFSELEPLAWQEAKRELISRFEKSYLQNLLRKYHGVVALCARHAGIQPPDFWKLMRKYRLKAKTFR